MQHLDVRKVQRIGACYRVIPFKRAAVGIGQRQAVNAAPKAVGQGLVPTGGFGHPVVFALPYGGVRCGAALDFPVDMAVRRPVTAYGGRVYGGTQRLRRAQLKTV